MKAYKSNRVFLLLSIIFFAITLKFQPVPIHNQHEYYLHAFARVHPELLQNDAFVQTQPKHVVFSGLIELLYRPGIVDIGSHVIDAAFKAILYFSLFMISKSIIVSIDKHKKLTAHQISRLAYIIIFVFLFLHETYVVTEILTSLDTTLQISLQPEWLKVQTWIFEGFAAQRIYEGHLLPASFGVLVLLAIVSALHSRWRIAAILLAIVVNFHFSYSIHSGVLIVVFALWLFLKKQHVLAVQVLFIFGIAVLPITLDSLSILEDADSGFVNELLVIQLYPSHALPSQFWAFGHTLKTFIFLLSAIVCFRIRSYFLSLLIALATVSLIIGTLYVHLADDYTVALMFPWRSSVYLVPLSFVIIATLIGVYAFSHFIPTRFIDSKAIVVVVALLVLVEGLGFVQSILSPDIQIDNRQLFFDEINRVTDPADVILVPAKASNGLLETKDWGFTRLLSQRAVYVDSLAVPMLGKDVIAWYDRIQFAENFYEQSLQTQVELCKEANVDYFVTESFDDTSDIEPVANVDNYYLFACEDSED